MRFFSIPLGVVVSVVTISAWASDPFKEVDPKQLTYEMSAVETPSWSATIVPETKGQILGGRWWYRCVCLVADEDLSVSLPKNLAALKVGKGLVLPAFDRKQVEVLDYGRVGPFGGKNAVVEADAACQARYDERGGMPGIPDEINVSFGEEDSCCNVPPLLGCRAIPSPHEE